MNWLWSTESERLSYKSWKTVAHGQVVDDSALSVLTADAGTRILTLVTNTSLVRRTVRVDCTLWTTAFIGVAKVSRLAGA